MRGHSIPFIEDLLDEIINTLWEAEGHRLAVYMSPVQGITSSDVAIGIFDKIASRLTRGADDEEG